MRIFGLGPMEIGLILLVALLFFGPKRLPQLGKSLGKTIKSLREGIDGKDELEGDAETPQPKQSAPTEKDSSGSEE